MPRTQRKKRIQKKRHPRRKGLYDFLTKLLVKPKRKTQPRLRTPTLNENATTNK